MTPAGHHAGRSDRDSERAGAAQVPGSDTLRAQDVHFAYDGPPVLQGVTLEVPAGESGFILGPSGCGKSTLLRCIAGLEKPQAGTIELGQDVTAQPVHRRRIGMLFQEPALFPHLSVQQNVAFGMRYRGLPKAKQAEEAERYLQMVDLPAHGSRPVDELSGGQRQRVALARTLAAKPLAVLLDEPFGSLDRELRDELGPRVKDMLAQQGVPALWVTHDRDEAMRIGDRVWQMVDGRIEPVVGAPEDEHGA